MLVPLGSTRDRPLPLPVVVVERTSQTMNATVLRASSGERSRIICRLNLVKHLLSGLLLLANSWMRSKLIRMAHHAWLWRVLISNVSASSHTSRSNAGATVASPRSAPCELPGGYTVRGIHLSLLSSLIRLLAIVIEVVE
jgi:hypothetical protein